MPVVSLAKPLSVGLEQVKRWVADDLADTLRSLGDIQFEVAAAELVAIDSTVDWHSATWNAINHLQGAAATFKTAVRAQALGAPYAKVFDSEKELAAEFFLFACFLRLGEYKRARMAIADIEDVFLYWGFDPETTKFIPSARTIARGAGATAGYYLHPISTMKWSIKIGLIRVGVGAKKRRGLPVDLVRGLDPRPALIAARQRIAEAEAGHH